MGATLPQALKVDLKALYSPFLIKFSRITVKNYQEMSPAGSTEDGRVASLPDGGPETEDRRNRTAPDPGANNENRETRTAPLGAVFIVYESHLSGI